MERGFQILDIAHHSFLPAVDHRSGTHQRGDWRYRAAEHGLAHVLLVILWEGLHFSGEAREACSGPWLETVQPFPYVGEEAVFALFAVRRNIDPAFDLPAHTLRHGIADPAFIG